MKKWKTSKKPINLQLFAESEGEGGAEGKDTAQPNNDSNNQDDKPDSAEKTYTEAELNAIVEQRLADERQKADEEKSEAEKLANMNAQERAEYERDQLQEKLNQLENEKAIAQMTSTARKILSDAGINAPDEIVSVLVSKEADKTKSTINGFITLFNKTVENAVKDALKGAPPKTSDAAGVTKEQIIAIKDPIARQAAIRENIELFK